MTKLTMFSLFTTYSQCLEQCLASSKHSIICCGMEQNYFCREATGDSYEAGGMHCILREKKPKKTLYIRLPDGCRNYQSGIRRSLWEEPNNYFVPSSHSGRESEMRWKMLKLSENVKILTCIWGDSMLGHYRLDGSINIFSKERNVKCIKSKTFYMSALF